MTYRSQGEGPPLFVVPGIASTYQIYALLLNQLGSRFRTIIYDYPGEHADDGARLEPDHPRQPGRRPFWIDRSSEYRPGVSGSGSRSARRSCSKRCIASRRRFPRAAVQGAFAHRRFSAAERLALWLGRLVPGKVKRLPFRRQVLNYNGKPEFPAILADRWPFYVEKNGETPIRSFAHRVGLLTTLDLRPILPRDPDRDPLIQGREDRIVARTDFELLESSLPKAQGVIVPTAGHVLHLTHAELQAQVDRRLAPACAPEGCTARAGDWITLICYSN